MHDFDDIHDEFRPKIHRYLGNICSSEEADDLTQAVFLKVSDALPGFRGDASYATWIYRIATNIAIDHARSRKMRQQEREIHESEPILPDELSDPDALGTDEEFIRQEMSGCIREVVAGLPEHYRIVLMLSDYEGLSNAEIAEIIGENIGTVKIRLHRSRATLRKALECACTLYHDQRNVLMCDRGQ